MPLNGSGGYAAPASTWNPAVTNTSINSTDWAALLADITTALSTAIYKDGQQTPTANLPMGGFKLTGLGAGSASGNSIRYEQVLGLLTTAGDLSYATSAGTLARLAIGTADQPLVVNAGATAPQWGFATKSANTVLAGPSSGAAAAPAFRALVPADLSMTPITNSLSGDVSLSNSANYFDGPSVAQGTAGTWFVSGTVTVADGSIANAAFNAKLWDGTTVIASALTVAVSSGNPTTISLSGYLASPAGNLRISVRQSGATTGVIKFNSTSNSKDSTITAIRIA